MNDFSAFDSEVKRLQAEGYVGPDDITDKALARMTQSQLAAMVRPGARERTRYLLRRTRTDPVRPAGRPNSVEAQEDLAAGRFTRFSSVEEMDAALDEVTASVVQLPTPSARKSAGVANSTRSWRQFDPDERLARKLSGQFSWGGHKWGVTGDLMLDQVRRIAANYQREGQVLVEKGLDWGALAGEMVSHEATRIRDLPRSVLVAFFLREDAA